MDSRQDFVDAGEAIQMEALRLLDKSVYFKNAFLCADGPRDNAQRAQAMRYHLREISQILDKMEYFMRASQDGEWFDDAPVGLSEEQRTAWLAERKEGNHDGE